MTSCSLQGFEILWEPAISMFMVKVIFLFFTEDGGSMSFEMLPAYQIYLARILEYLSVYILKNEAANSFRKANNYVSNFT